MVYLRNILFWFMLVLGIGFLYHITNDFIISNAISETIEEESETEEEPDCE